MLPRAWDKYRRICRQETVWWARESEIPWQGTQDRRCFRANYILDSSNWHLLWYLRWQRSPVHSEWWLYQWKKRKGICWKKLTLSKNAIVIQMIARGMTTKSVFHTRDLRWSFVRASIRSSSLRFSPCLPSTIKLAGSIVTSIGVGPLPDVCGVTIDFEPNQTRKSQRFLNQWRPLSSFYINDIASFTYCEVILAQSSCICRWWLMRSTLSRIDSALMITPYPTVMRFLRSLREVCVHACVKPTWWCPLGHEVSADLL